MEELRVKETMKENTIGIIYPLPSNLVNAVLDRTDSIFIKYPRHQTISARLKSCKKLIIYESNAGMLLAGEGNIKKVELLQIDDVLGRHPNLLFMPRKEVEEYSKGRKNKKLLVFHLTNSIKYPKPIKYDHPLTMAGEYISKEKYESLIRHIR